MTNNKDTRLPNEPKVHIPVSHERAIGMSNRQFAFLRYLASAPKQIIGLEELSHLNQGTVGSFKRASRKYIVETPDRQGVQLTYEGKEALKQFEHGDFMRSVARMRFSSFLSLDVYDEKDQPSEGGKGKSKAARYSVRASRRKSPGRPKAQANVLPMRKRAHAA